MNTLTLMTFSLSAALIQAQQVDDESGFIVMENEEDSTTDLTSAAGNKVNKQRRVTDTFLENGAPAWEKSHDGLGTFQDFPQHYLSNTAFQFKVPSNYKAKVGTYANYRCPKSRGSCDVVVFAYECAGCGRNLKTGDLFKDLSSKGFSRTRCAPTFTTGKQGGKKYQMVAYVKTLAPLETERVVLTEKTHFVAFAMSFGNSPACDSLANTVDGCDSATDFRCQYKPHTGCALRTCVVPMPLAVGCQPEHCPLNEY